MPNRSKTSDPRFWARWRASGAVESIEETEFDLEIDAVGYNHKTNVSMLSLGRVLQWTNQHFTCYKPFCYIAVKGDAYRPGQVVRVRRSGGTRDKPTWEIAS